MEIYLIRHTTPAIEKGVCYGQTDIGLAKTFPSEAQKIKERLALGNNRLTVYSSPLKRCLQLANYLTRDKVYTDNRLMELDFGDWEMKRWDAIDKNILSQWMNDFVNMACPNGESYKDLSRRSLSFYQEIQRGTNHRILIITHGGVIRSIMAEVTKIPLKKSFEIVVECGSITEFGTNDKSNQFSIDR